MVYIGLALVGWYWWLRGGPAGRGVGVHYASPAALATCIATVAVLTVVLHWALDTYTGSTDAPADAFTTSLSLVAQLMLSRKWVQNWWLWITADVLYIWLYGVKELWLTAGLYVIFLGLCIVGLRAWRASLSARLVTPVPPAATGSVR